MIMNSGFAGALFSIESKWMEQFWSLNVGYKKKLVVVNENVEAVNGLTIESQIPNTLNKIVLNQEANRK